MTARVVVSWRHLLFALLLLGCNVVNAVRDLPGAVYEQTRRLFNFGSLLGSATNSACPYDRIMGHPVFQVTTAWGSAYMNMERLNDMDELGAAEPQKGSKPTSISEESNEYRTVALFYMDPDDAIAAHSELKQLEQMAKSDIRITSSSLGKAIRQAANLGNGLVTGMPIKPLDGNLKPVDEGGSLRYKIMPPKKQLFYAARCIGKERVGLFSASSSDDANAAILGNSALETNNLIRRRDKRERKTPKARTAMEAQNVHMEGYCGIPVFYAPNLARKQPLLKRLLSGCGPQEIPLFFNYEDMVEAWGKMKQRSGKVKNSIPDLPPNAEVFNLWDVLTSMDRDSWKQTHSTSGKKVNMDAWLKPIKKRVAGVSSKNQPPGLESITFVPSSGAVSYKNAISGRGNGKARLRPMR